MSKAIKYKINLIPEDPFFKTTLGRTLNWSLNIGRYILIFTLLVVIMSFGSRFVIDRKLTDLNESIYQKQLIIESQTQPEKEFRLAQAKIKSYQEIQQQNNIVEIFPLLQQVVPNGFKLVSLKIRQNQITGEGIADANNALNLFINNLQLSPHFENIKVSKIEVTEDSVGGINVTFSADLVI